MIQADDVIRADKVLVNEYEHLYGGTLYIKDPFSVFKRLDDGRKDDALVSCIRGFSGAESLLDNIRSFVHKRREEWPNHQVEDALKTCTVMLNRARKKAPSPRRDKDIGDLQTLLSAETSDQSETSSSPKIPVNSKIIGALVGAQRYALCLSGGGIRSATFNLGLLQGLTYRGLLGQFEYLSTVSGGGFIGGWLSAWIHRRNDEGKGLEKVLCDLKEHPDVDEIRYLREHSNYLSPKTGFLSADSWVFVSTYLRNLFVTALIFIPWLLLALLVPRAMYSITFALVDSGKVLFVIGLVATGIALCSIALDLPVVRGPVVGDRRHGKNRFIERCLVPLIISSWCFAVFAWSTNSLSWQAVLICCAVLILLPGRLAVGQAGGALKHVGVLLVGLILAVLPIGALTQIASADIRGWFGDEASGKILYVCIFPPLILVLMTVSGTFISASTSRFTTESDEEWWARAGAYILLTAFLWFSVGMISLYLPQYLYRGLRYFVGSPSDYLRDRWLSAISALGVLVTVFSVVGARSTKTSGSTEPRQKASRVTPSMDSVVSLLSWIALIYVFLYLNLGLDRLLLVLGNLAVTPQSWHWDIVTQAKTEIFLAAIGLGLFILVCLLINGNKYTAHYFYRDRIMRAFIGASRREGAHPFLGLSEKDHIPVASLHDQRPFHVINLAVNLAGSDRLALQERKAESFAITPLYAGSPWLGYQSSREYGKGQRGLSLGSAMAISGAAVSPQMGYMMKSRAARFLMAMFAVRLGCWLGNPNSPPKIYKRSHPGFSAVPLFNEALGLTSESGRYVYLSDGGHFENLGIYEMVMRGCTYIVASDASTDSSYEFESLAMAIQKIRIDFGIPIEFGEFGDIGRFNDSTGTYCAIGKIKYSVLGEGVPDGTLLYIKAALTGNEPRDVIHYRTATGDFPQQAISDQFFNETQFESYRALGSHIIRHLAPNLSNDKIHSIPAFLNALETSLQQQNSTQLQGLARNALRRAAGHSG